MSEISQLNPQIVWKHFDQLCAIPRPSHHEQGVIDYIESFADGLGLEHEIDPAGNLIVRKNATTGMENCKGIIIQGHMDIVAQKENDLVHDFEKDPIQPYIDGDWVTAKGTTLGSDNGIGVAMALAVLETTDIPHPPIETLFTVNEECGMSGALGLQPGYLKGDWLLNIDTEEEGELYVGCAGGKDIVISYPLEYVDAPENTTAFELNVGSLKGGHSGVDIHLNRANANKITNQFLLEGLQIGGIYVASFDGGSLRNAIPRDATTRILIDKQNIVAFKALAEKLTASFRQKYQAVDPDICISLNPCDDIDRVMRHDLLETFVKVIDQCPNGVDSWIKDLPDVVETSDNLARILTEDNVIDIEISVRSSVEEERERLSNQIKTLFENAGAKVEFGNAYPGWKPEMNSELLKLTRKIYKDCFGKDAGVKVIHAGLECGVLGAVYPHWEMISFGPTITGAHSPDERCNIKDVEKVWKYLLEILKNVPQK